MVKEEEGQQEKENRLIVDTHWTSNVSHYFLVGLYATVKSRSLARLWGSSLDTQDVCFTRD